MNSLRAALLEAVLAVTPAAMLGHMALAAGGDVVSDVRAASDARNFALAEREIQSYRSTVGVTPEMLEALSWLARGTLDDKQYDRADKYALETRKLSLELLNRAGKGDAPLITALGAAIEVHGQVLAARGQRAEAVTYLKAELATWVGSPIAARIQKNINLLSLEGKPAPALDVAHWLGAQPSSLAALKGHPVLLFFWAHWCGDCKAEVPILARLMEAYGSKGLVLVGPTQVYGYTAPGDGNRVHRPGSAAILRPAPKHDSPRRHGELSKIRLQHHPYVGACGRRRDRTHVSPRRHDL